MIVQLQSNTASQGKLGECKQMCKFKQNAVIPCTAFIMQATRVRQCSRHDTLFRICNRLCVVSIKNQTHIQKRLQIKTISD